MSYESFFSLLWSPAFVAIPMWSLHNRNWLLKVGLRNFEICCLNSASPLLWLLFLIKSEFHRNARSYMLLRSRKCCFSAWTVLFLRCKEVALLQFAINLLLNVQAILPKCCFVCVHCMYVLKCASLKRTPEAVSCLGSYQSFCWLALSVINAKMKPVKISLHLNVCDNWKGYWQFVSYSCYFIV